MNYDFEECEENELPSMLRLFATIVGAIVVMLGLVFAYVIYGA